MNISGSPVDLAAWMITDGATENTTILDHRPDTTWSCCIAARSRLLPASSTQQQSRTSHEGANKFA
jgi:hypothetical protein